MLGVKMIALDVMSIHKIPCEDPKIRWPYDPQNIFARILRRELPCDSVAETAHTLAFRDKFPQAPVHILVIPKGAYTCADAFFQTACDDEILDFFRLLGKISAQVGCEQSGFRLISNQGRDGGQEVPHFHIHLLAQGSVPSV